MKTRRDVKMPEVIRKGRGVRIVGQKTPPKKTNEDTSESQIIKPESRFHPYYEAGKVYAFTVGSCISDQLADGKQHTKYIVKDKRGERHNYYCDCTRFKNNQEIFLRVREISNWELQFEPSIIERLDEIFLKGEEYEFEVISCTNKRCVVCDVQIGKNHHLIIDAGQRYERGEILRLEVQGYNDNGDLVLIDHNPPAPVEPTNSLQVMAETMAKSPQKETPQFFPKQYPPISDCAQSDSRDTPKVAPSIAIPRENKRILVEDLGYTLPPKEGKHVPSSAEKTPVYTRSLNRPQAKPQVKPQPEPQPEPQPKAQPGPQPEQQPAPQPKTQPEPQPEQQPALQPVPQPEPHPEPHPEIQPEAQPGLESQQEPNPCNTSVLQVFMAWMDGIPGMERTEDYTLYSGNAEVVETIVLPVYQQQKACVAENLEDHTVIKPLYVRIWQLIKRYFSRN